MPDRPDAKEKLDGPLDDPTTLAGNLRDLSRINRWLGGVAVTRRVLDHLVGRGASHGVPVSLLDVGTGAADIPVALLAEWERRRWRLEVTAVDHRPEVLDAARRANPDLERTSRLVVAVADGHALPYEDRSFDVAHCSLLLHHLDEIGAVALLREMARVSRRGVVVNDVASGRLRWAGAWLLAHVATRNAYTRHDAPLSVRRAWTVDQARALLAVAGLRPVAEAGAIGGSRWAIAAVPA